MADLDRARRDFGYFAHAIGVPLTDGQIAAVTTDKTMLAPRGGGKTMLLATWATWRAFSRPNHRVLIASSDEKGSRRLHEEAQRIALASPLLADSIVDEFSQVTTLRNGSELRAVSATPRGLRGWHGDLAADEVQQWPEETLVSSGWPIIASSPGAKVVMAGTASVASGPFFDVCRAGEAGSGHIHFTQWGLADCPWITATFIEAMRASMSPTRFAAEMEGRWASSADTFVSRAALELITYDGPIHTLDTITGPARIFAGVDWGSTRDHCAIRGFGRVPCANELPLFCVVLAQAYPSGYPVNKFIQEVVDSRAHIGVLSPERVGMGEGYTHWLWTEYQRRADEDGGAPPRPRAVLIEDKPWDHNWLDNIKRREPSVWKESAPSQAWRTRINPVHTSGPIKAAMYAGLRLLIDRQQIVIPSGATDLLRELLLLRVDLTPSGHERIEATSGGFDDLCDSLAMAMAPYKSSIGRWSTLLEKRADPGARQPRTIDANVPTTTTPGGRVVPRGLVFSSISGHPSLTGEVENLPVGAERRGNWLIRR